MSAVIRGSCAHCMSIAVPNLELFKIINLMASLLYHIVRVVHVSIQNVT